MYKTDFPPATYIETPADLQRLVEILAAETLLAIDTESNSLYAYQECVCLIQLSTRTEDYIIDPLAIDDIQPLAPLMASETIQKVFHAAEYDIVCMKRDFGFTFNNLFDTMVASRVCGFELVGLGNLLSKYVGVKTNKRHQRDDWGKRPLSTDSLLYAQMDTHHLPFIRDQLAEQLEKMGRMAEAQEIFDEIRNYPAAEMRCFDPKGFWNIGSPNMLERDEMRILSELYTLREKLAKKRDVPSFKVMDNKALIALSQSAPTSKNRLQKVNGMNHYQIKNYGDKIIQAIQRGKEKKELPPPPRRTPPSPVISERYTALHLWRKERAIERGVSSDVIISKNTLWDVAHKDPASLDELQYVQGIGPWRLGTYGDEILGILEKFK